MSALAAATLLLLAQAPAAGAETLPYRVGPGDVLEVVVDGRPDLSRLPTVQTTGSVWLPRAGEVEVRGLSTGEIAARLTPLLAGEDLAAPRVAVRVREYQSQFVWVRGSVQRPGRKPLRSGTRLLDALLDAGGFQEGASGEVAVERAAGTFADGSRAAHFRFGGKEPDPAGARRARPAAAGRRRDHRGGPALGQRERRRAEPGPTPVRGRADVASSSSTPRAASSAAGASAWSCAGRAARARPTSGRSARARHRTSCSRRATRWWSGRGGREHQRPRPPPGRRRPRRRAARLRGPLLRGAAVAPPHPAGRHRDRGSRARRPRRRAAGPALPGANAAAGHAAEPDLADRHRRARPDRQPDAGSPVLQHPAQRPALARHRGARGGEAEAEGPAGLPGRRATRWASSSAR